MSKAPCAPGTLQMLAQFSVLTRLKEHENSSLFSKMRVYNSETLKDTDPHAKTIQEYRDAAGINEGMDGTSTRFAYKVLSETFNFDTHEVAADPVHLMFVLEQAVRREQLPEEREGPIHRVHQGGARSPLRRVHRQRDPEGLSGELLGVRPEPVRPLRRLCRCLDRDQDFQGADTGNLMNRQILDQELSKIEKPAGIANPKDFRYEVVSFSLRARARNGGKNPSWTSYEKIREVIEKRMFSQVEDLLPVISFGAKKDEQYPEEARGVCVTRMVSRGYTPAGPALGRMVHAGEEGRMK